MRKRTWTDDAMRVAVEKNHSIRGVLRELGLSETGANYKTVHRAVARLGVNTDHWKGQGYLKGKKCTWAKKRPLAEILVVGSSYRNTVSLKNRLLSEGVLENECSECGLQPEWNGKSLVMVLDHISGDNADNRKENLRLLCPNCNSQQKTFAGRNKGSCDGIGRHSALKKPCP